MKIQELRVDSEWKNLLRPQTPDEAQALRDSVMQHGWLSPIIVVALPEKGDPVFEGQGCIADGMHRVALWQQMQAEWLVLPPNVLGRRAVPEPPKPDIITRKFDSRDAVKEFILEHQAARRNLTQHELAMLRGKEFLEALDTMAKDVAAAAVAEKHNVSKSTVLRDADYAEAVDEIREVVPSIDVICQSHEAPSQKAVKEVHKVLKTEKTVSSSAGYDFKSLVTPDGRSIGDVLEEQLKKSRIDMAHGQKTPPWKSKLEALEKIVDKVVEQGDEDELRALRACVRKLSSKLPRVREKSDLDTVSKPPIPQKICGTPIAEYAESADLTDEEKVLIGIPIRIKETTAC